MTIQITLTTGPDLWPQPGDPSGESVEITALEGNDTVTGTSFSDLILGNQGNDSLEGGAGDDIIYGGQDDDTIRGTLGNNLLLGNLGNDIIFTGSGNDTVYGGQDNDTITATSGNNFIYGNLGNDSIIAGSGDDYIHGGQNDDTIVASVGGTDTLIGGVGNDTLVFAADTSSSGDILDGGDGQDTFVVEGNTDFSGTTLSSIEIVNIATSAVAIFSQANLTAAGITSITGSGSIQAAADPANPTQVVTLDLTGIAVGGTVVIRDSAGNIVGGSGTDNPSDPDKLRPIQVSLTVGVDDVSFSGRADAPLASVLGDVITVPTLQSGDRIRGLGESDVLTVRIGSNNINTNVPTILPQVVDVETINFTAETLNLQGSSGNPFFYGASQTTGTTKLVSSDNTGVVRVTGIRDNAEVILRNSVAGFQTTFASNVTGTATIRLQNVKAANDFLSVEPQAGGGFTEWNVFSETGEFQTQVTNELADIRSRLGGGTTSLRTVNIAGKQNLTLTAQDGQPSLPQEVITINAGNTAEGLGVFEGDLKIDEAPDSELFFQGGKGDDFINFGSTLDQKDNVNGGDGDDTVAAIFTPANQPPSTLRIKDVENLNLNVSGDVKLPFNSVIGVEKINFSANTGIVEITGITNTPAITFKGNRGFNAQSTNGLTINGTAATDELKLSYENNGIAMLNGGPYNAGLVATQNIETISVDVKDGNLNLPSITTNNSLSTVNFEATNSVNIPGNIGTPGGTDVIDTIDASKVEGKFSARSNSLSRGAVVTLGKGDSIFDATDSATNGAGPNGITIKGQGGNDQITGTAFNDAITGAGGADILTGAAGADTFVYTALSDSLLATRDQITDYTVGADRIDAPVTVDLTNQTVFDAGFVANLTESSIQPVLNATDFAANRAAVFNDGINTYVAFNNGTAGFQAGSDSIIQINGAVLNAAQITII